MVFNCAAIKYLKLTMVLHPSKMVFLLTTLVPRRPSSYFKFGWVFWKCTWSPFRVIRSSILKRHLVVIQVKAFQFSVPLWPLWKQINLVEYFEKTLSRHLGESLPIFNFFVTFVEINKFDQVFWKDTWSPFRWKISNFHFFCDLCGNE